MLNWAFILSLPLAIGLVIYAETTFWALLIALIHLILFKSEYHKKFHQLISIFIFSIPSFKKTFWHWAYTKLSAIHPGEDFTCMNYGYHDINKGVFINDCSDEKYCLQLYHCIASGLFSVDSYDGLNILEVGSGRGGGLAYVAKTFNPKKATGVDFCEDQVKLCQSFHKDKRIEFIQGDAMNLPIETGSMDVVINIESSHCYADIEKFLREVHRVLKPNGKFFYTDMLMIESWEDREKIYKKVGFRTAKKVDISGNVIASLEAQHDWKLKKIENFNWLKRYMLGHFIGLKGSRIHRALSEKTRVYLAYHFEKD